MCQCERQVWHICVQLYVTLIHICMLWLRAGAIWTLPNCPGGVLSDSSYPKIWDRLSPGQAWAGCGGKAASSLGSNENRLRLDVFEFGLAKDGLWTTASDHQWPPVTTCDHQNSSCVMSLSLCLVVWIRQDNYIVDHMKGTHVAIRMKNSRIRKHMPNNRLQAEEPRT